MAEWPGLPAGYDLPLVNSSTKRLPDPTMDAIEQALIPTIAAQAGGRDRMTAVIIGSSLEQQNGAGAQTLDPAGGDALRSRGWFHWMNAVLAAQGKGLQLLANAGIGGNRWDQMDARFNTDVIALNPDMIIIGSATNSISAETSIEPIKASGLSMIAKAEGRRVVILALAPRSNVSTSAKRVMQQELNRWLRTLPFTYRNVTIVDPWAEIVDPATGNPYYGTTLDGTHYSIAGAMRVGFKIAKAVAPLIPLSTPVEQSYSLDPRRFMDNPTFQENGKGWVSASGGATITYTQATDSFGNRANVAVTGNSSLTNIRGIGRTQSITGFVQAGDIVQASARIKWSALVALGGNTPCNPELQIRQLDAGGAVLRTAYANYSASSEWELTYPTTSNANPWPVPAAGEIVLTTYRTTIHADCASLQVLIGWRGAASVNMEISDFAPLKDTAATLARPSEPPAVRASAGVAGYSGRWISNELAGSNGTAVASWPDAESGLALYHPTAGNRPTVQTVGSEKVVRYDGVDDYLYNTAVGSYESRVMVCRVLSDAPASDQGIMSSDSTGNPAGATNVGIIRRNASGLAGTYFTDSRTFTSDGAGAWPLGQWVVLAIRHSNGDARAERNGALIAASSAAGTVLPAGVAQGRRTSSYGRIEVAEDIIYPGKLSDADMAAVYAAMVANHPSLFA